MSSAAGAAALSSEVASKISSSASVHNTLSKIFGKKSTTSHKSNKKKTLKATSVILLPAAYKTAPRGWKKEELRERAAIFRAVLYPPRIPVTCYQRRSFLHFLH